jgi:diguanylate cyclase (GGDEF)-like protein
MNNIFDLTGMIIIINDNGVIKKVLYDKNFNINANNIFEILVQKYVSELKKILDYLKYNSVFVDFTIGLVLEGELHEFIMTAIKLDEDIVLIFNNDNTEKISREFLKINNEQLNTLRQVIKELPEKNIIPSEEKLLNEIIKINNELINTKRELEKKNLELDLLNKKLEELSIKDSLTELYNRRYFYIKIKEELTRAKRKKYKLSIVSIDLNNFKEVNDTYGHDEGDRVLMEFGKIAKGFLRDNFDSIYRFGGDEFVIVLMDCDAQNAQKVLNRINEELKKFNPIISLSYGIEEIDYTNNSNQEIKIEEVLKNTDKKMYDFKREFKSKYSNKFNKN